MIKRKKINQNGSALAYALVVMACAMIVLTSMISYVISQVKFSANRANRAQALDVAEAGIYWYRWYLTHEVAGKTAQQINDFWQGGTAYGVDSPYEKDYDDENGKTIGHYSISVQKPDSGSTIVLVKSTGWTLKEPNTKRTVQVRFRRPSWSEYAVLANNVMRFGEGTEVYGKIHSNQGIRFDGVIHNVISSSVSSYQDPDHFNGPEFGVHTHVNPPPGSGINDNFRSAEAPPNSVPDRSDVFKAGRQFPVPTISFAGVTSDLSYIKTEAQSGAGKYFDSSGQGRQIILNSDGTYDVYTVDSYDSGVYWTGISRSNRITGYAGTRNSDGSGNACTTGASSYGPDAHCVDSYHHHSSCYCKKSTYDIPDNGIIFVENNIWLEGTINNKKVTIVAANLSGGAEANVFVGNNDLLYTNFDGRDILGVIAQNDVEVIENSRNVLTLDGAFIAKDGRVGRDNYGTSDYKSSITLNGSMATNLRYGFAWTNSLQDWGYDIRNLNFDNNLLYYPPPYFPTGTEYSIDLWKEL